MRSQNRKGPSARAFREFAEFFSSQVTGGRLLIASAVIALIIANSPVAQGFHDFLQVPMQLGVDPIVYSGSLEFWINEGLMAVFFLLVGLEIKREILIGELSSFQQAALPVIAAIGGMAVPALIYLSICHGTAGGSGWGIPMATDIAFSLGILAMVARSAPAGLKVFLTALAIIDDLGAVLIIAIVYSANLDVISLLVAAGILIGLAAANKLGVKALWIYLVAGIPLWLFILKSGVHPTVAGVLLAAVIPMKGKTANHASPLVMLEHGLNPVITYFIVPVFALTNAGVHFGGVTTTTFLQPVTMGVFAGLAIGKVLGIAGFSWLAVRAKLGALSSGISWRMIIGGATLGGIGFTMSLFIANLAFTDPALIESAKLGIVSASTISALVGWAVLTGTSRKHKANVQAHS